MNKILLMVTGEREKMSVEVGTEKPSPSLSFFHSLLSRYSPFIFVEFETENPTKKNAWVSSFS